MRFTDLALKSLTVEAGQRVFFDDHLPGFGLRVSPKSKRFVLLIRHRNQTKWETLGTFPAPLSLSEARKRARARLAAFQLGEMPAITFSEAQKLYIETHLPHTREANRREQTRILRQLFEPHLGHRPLSALKIADIAPIIDRVPTVPSARAAFVAIRTFINWSVKRGHLDTSPLGRFQPPKRPPSRERVLTPDELLAIWHACPDSPYGDIVRLLILTGQRRGQWAAYRAEFLTGGIVTWPGSLMKAAKPHSLPTTPRILSILSTYPNGMPPIGSWTRHKDALTEKSGVKNWRIHDLRRSFSTILAENCDIEPHYIDAILAHASGTPVSRIYNRARYGRPMLAALEAFDAFLTHRNA